MYIYIHSGTDISVVCGASVASHIEAIRLCFVRRAGYEPVTTGWWLHELVMKVQLTFPWAFGKYSEMVHFDLRKRFQRKQARLAKDAQKNN